MDAFDESDLSWFLQIINYLTLLKDGLWRGMVAWLADILIGPKHDKGIPTYALFGFPRMIAVDVAVGMPGMHNMWFGLVDNLAAVTDIVVNAKQSAHPFDQAMSEGERWRAHNGLPIVGRNRATAAEAGLKAARVMESPPRPRPVEMVGKTAKAAAKSTAADHALAEHLNES